MIPFRKSSYLIDIPLDNGNGKHMFIHGYTGAIDIAGSDVANLLKMRGPISKDNSNIPRETFDALVQRGYLTQKTVEEEREFCKRWANFLHLWKKRFALRTFMFMVTYDCNFRCPYCYESEVSEGGRKWTKKTFTKDLVDRAFDAMLEIEPNRQKHSNLITLYGGEPLLAQNHDIIKYIVNIGNERGYKFDAITNGYEIDRYPDLLGPDKIYRLQISIDGPKEVHDKRRYHFKDGGTFDKICQNIAFALDKGTKVGIRANVDATNYMYVESLYNQFAQAGYVKNPDFVFSAALVVGSENITPTGKVMAAGDKEPTLLSKMDFNDKMLQTKVPGQHQEMWIYRKLYNAIKYNALIDFSPVYCAVQTGAYILDPFGDIYNCWETVGKKEHIIGHYIDGITWEAEKEKWHMHNIATVSKCAKCKYALLCGGGCMAKALTAYNDLSLSYCHSFPSIFGRIANNVYDSYIKENNLKQKSL